MNKLRLCVAGMLASFLGAGCQSEADRVTSDFKGFCQTTEVVIGGIEEGPDVLKVTYDVAHTSSTIRPYSATIKVLYTYKDKTASADANYVYEDGQWKTGELGDFGPVADLREEKRRNTFKDMGMPEAPESLVGTPEERREIRSRDLFVLQSSMRFRKTHVPDVKEKILRLYELITQDTTNLKLAAEALKSGDLALSSDYMNKSELLEHEEKQIKTSLGWN